MNVQSIRPHAAISALPLMVAIEDLAGAAQLGQVRALVAQRQADIGPFVSEREVSIDLQARQSEIRRHVTHYLDRLVPESIGSISGMEHCVALVQSAQVGLQEAPDDETRDMLLAAIVPVVEEARDRAADMKRLVERELHNAKLEVDALGQCIDDYAGRVRDEEDGELARLEAQIDEANEAMSKAVAQTVTSGMKIGAQAKKLITWIFSMFSSEPDAEKPKDSKGDASTKKAHAGDAQEGSGDKKPGEKKTKGPSLKKPEEPFPGETIGEISGETSTVLDAGSELNRNAARLRDLYLKLYNLDAVLGAAALIKRQGRDYVTAVAQLQDAVLALTRCWDALAEACRHPDPTIRAESLFDSSWSQLDRRIAFLVGALSQGGQAIAPLGRMENVVSINQPGASA